MNGLLARATERGYRVYLLGARPDVVGDAVAALRMRHPEVVLAGYRHGYFARSEEGEVVSAIAAARPDILFLALETPQKELFLARHRETLHVPFAMGVGGSLDVLAGRRRRAPRWAQRAGLEWAFRLVQEPRRLGRRYAVGNARFAWLVARELVRSRRWLAANERGGGGRNRRAQDHESFRYSSPQHSRPDWCSSPSGSGARSLGSSLRWPGSPRFFPGSILVFALLAGRHRVVLVYAALALALWPGGFASKEIGLGALVVTVPDVLVLFALGSWVAALLLKSPDDPVPTPRSMVVGIPLVLLALGIGQALIRGHDAYGVSLIGQPLRIALYAGLRWRWWG